MYGRVCSVVMAILALLVVSGCTEDSQEGNNRLQVAASFSILADVAGNVAGDAADVISLVPLGAEPHGYTPSPRDMVALTDAGVVLIVGANFEEGLMESIENAGDEVNVVVASACVEIQIFGGEHEGEEHEHEDEGHEHEGEEPEQEGEIAELCQAHHAGLGNLREEPEYSSGMLYLLDCGGHEHGAGGCDPHMWTDPHNVMLWALMIRDTMSELDPDNAEIYADNAAAYIGELKELVEQIESLVETIPEENRKLVTNHHVFGYYASRFGFEVVSTVIPAASDLSEPSAAQVAALIDAIDEQNVLAIFADSTANPDLAQQIAADTGANFYTLYTGSLSAEDSPAGTYLDYMRYNTQTIVEALGG